ncbi:hypothetical protein KDI_03290 [Dictyobacter arantiisoli]|uniref:BACON domain-containing protein n=1 Tax=Dictyobacter arantiisoli TaxID=2014874 RepID=A0A5A5T6B1_9CHLR|nr:hypothetical protein KDI_03290 [Dictyobacter arantiisoli]
MPIDNATISQPRPEDELEPIAVVATTDVQQDPLPAYASATMHSASTYLSLSRRKGEMHPQPAWQKVVETPRRPSTTYPPRPPVPLHAWPVLRHIPYGWLLFPRLLSRPRSFFWLSLLVLLFLMAGSLLRITQFLAPLPVSGKDSPSITVSPQPNVSVGEQLTIQLAGFQPGVKVGLFLDEHIPIFDTHGRSQLFVKQDGTFIDTVTVSEYWGVGTHKISVEDADRHQSYGTSILVMANLGSILPAHFHLKVANELDPDTLNLGAGDQATNSIRSIHLTNSGMGLISWQANAQASWLLISPQSGNVIGDAPAEVKIAVDRANLEPGHYTSDITFASSAGNRTLHVTMQVLTLAFGLRPVLQLTPALLSFTGVDGDVHLAPQVITVSNPGELPLNWQGSVSNPSWLVLSSLKGHLDAGGSATTQVEVNSGALLPGSYNAEINFTGVGSAPINAQTIYVNITIKAGCSLNLSTNVLSFIDVAHQAAPAAQALTVNQTPGCSVPLGWKALSNTSWLTIDQSSGTTPSSVKVEVVPAGLPAAPQTLNGSITFSYGQSTQVLLVNLTLSSVGPLLTVGTSTLSFSTTPGINSAVTQALPLTNTGDSAIAWMASTQASGGNWLSLKTSSGNLAARQSTTLQVSAMDLSTLTTITSYAGLVKIDGRSAQGKTVELLIPVQLTVNAACTLQVSPDTITFSSYQGQSGQPDTVHTVVMKAEGACKHNLQWTVTTTTTSGGNWLSAIPRSGNLAPNKSTATRVGVDLSGLTPNIYRGQVQIIARDSSNPHQIIARKTLDVFLNMQPPCTLLVPSQLALNFTPATTSSIQTFTVGITGNCGSGGVKVVATAASTNKWFSVSDPVVISRGGTATFSVTAQKAGLTQATGSISLTALEAGIAIVGSPQQVMVNFTPPPPPSFTITVSSAVINADNGKLLRSLTIANTGSNALTWSAALLGQQSFVALPVSSNTLAAGASATIGLLVDPTGLAAGTYAVHVAITATDSQTGMTTGPIDVFVPININDTATPSATSAPTEAPSIIPPLVPTNLVAVPSAAVIQSVTRAATP